METMSTALQSAKQFNDRWEILETASGGWELQLMTGGGALITYLTNPCPLNLGEHTKH